jgi:small subunit ribosomal protein S17
MTTTAKTKRKVRIGRVVSDKMQKTIVVIVETARRHRLYGKLVRRSRRYKVHDERNEARIGDIVQIEETRPLSKEKRWRLVEIIRRGTGELPPAEEAFVPVAEATATAAAPAGAAAEEAEA